MLEIVSPSNNFTTAADALNVTVHFRASANPDSSSPTGNVTVILLNLDGATVATYNNPPQIKEDAKTFIIDISKYQEGAHELQAFAYQGKINAALEGMSSPVSIVIKRGPPAPPTTPQSGFVHGYVFDAKTELPLKDVAVTVTGIVGTVFTDSQGKFAFPTPGTGDFGVTFKKEDYVFAQRKVTVVSTRDTAADPVYLTPLDPAVTVITNAGGTHIDSAGKVELTIPPNSLPTGTESIPVQATLYEHSSELPSPLPQTSFYTYALDIKPDGTNFTQPVSGKLANELGFAPGTQIPIGYYNSKTLKWEDTGLKGIVSSDGKWVEFQITHFSPYDINLPPSPVGMAPLVTGDGSEQKKDPKQHCAHDSRNSLVLLKSGELLLDHSLPAVRELNQEHSFTFIYNSHSADPSGLISVDTNLDPQITIVPATTTFKLSIEGKTIIAPYIGSSGKERYSYLYDCINGRGEKLSTGSYPYTVEISNDYLNMTYFTADYFGGPPIADTGIVTREPVSLTTTVKGRITVNNQQDSAFGSGWSLAELQRLYFDPDGSIFLTEGDGSALTFKKPDKPIQNIAVAKYVGNVSILSGRGDGIFQKYTAYPSLNYPDAIAAGDFNNDSFTDLVVCNFFDGVVSILLGNGDGTFNYDPEASYSGIGRPKAIVVGDFNNDRFQDIAFSGGAYGENSGISILMGNGDGTFKDAATYNVGTYGLNSSIAVGDFNNDGFQDIVLSPQFTGNFDILYGNGDGTFRDPVHYPIQSADDLRVAVGDFNRDKHDDIAVSKDVFGISVLLGRGDETFQNEVTYPPAAGGSGNKANFVIGDFNNDGIQDIASTRLNGVMSIYLGNGDGTFKNPIAFPLGFYPLVSYANSIAVGDFNNDSFADLVICADMYDPYGGSIYILLGNGSGTFQAPVRYPMSGIVLAATVFDSVNSSLYPEGAFTPPQGEYSHIMQNPDKTYTRFLKDGTRVIFNENGLHTQTIDKNGNIVTYDYADLNGDGKNDALSSIVLPTGTKCQFNYDSRGKLYSITDPAGRVTGFSIDTQGNLTQITNPDNTAKKYVYDTNHLITKKTDERGFSAQYFYDQYGAIRMVLSPEREVTEVTADGSVTQSRKNETRFYFPSDVKGLVNGPILLCGTPFLTNPLPVVRPEDMTAELIDGKGNIWTYRTNKFGGRLQFTDPLNNITTYERDGNSNLTKLIRANGSTVRMTYGSKGNLYSVKEKYDSAVTRLTYEPNFNQPTSIKDPQGNLTTLDYDSHGNPVQITDALGDIANIEFNPKGEPTKVIQASGTNIQNETNFSYDPVSFNLLSITDPLGHSTHCTYDAAGNIKTITDAEGKTTTYSYDSMNRITSVTDADNKTTTYAYDPAGNIVSVTDADNHTTAFAYDEQGQLIKTTNALNQQKQFSYDVNRNLSLMITPNGDNIKYYYNKANIPEKKFTPSDIDSYSYDSIYNLTGTSDSDTSLAFIYDPIGRLTQAMTNPGLLQPHISITYAYDLNNNRISLIASPSGEAISYTYDPLNRLTDIKGQQNNTISHFEYDQLSRRINKTLPLPNNQQIATNYTYDLASQLLSIAHQPLSLTYSYTYDDVGNRNTLTDGYGTHNYYYDNLYRLTQAIHPNIPQEQYAYDPVGNRNPASFVYDAVNRLLDDGTYAYSYDNNGNMTKKTNKTTGEVADYTYDSEDRLISVSGNITYSYDPLGRRIQKNVNGLITKYVYDGEDIIREYDGNNSLTASYIHGPSIDEPLVLDKGTQKYYYQTDGLGSVTSITDSNNNIVQSYTYDSFGNITNQTGSLTQPYTYTAREYDPETGLYYYRARYYDPKIGRFLQEDPVWDVNLYGYAGNNPINYTDPYGEQIGPGTLAATWGGALAEPTFVGEVVAAVITAKVLVDAIREASQYFPPKVPSQSDRDRLDRKREKDDRRFAPKSAPPQHNPTPDPTPDPNKAPFNRKEGVLIPILKGIRDWDKWAEKFPDLNNGELCK